MERYCFAYSDKKVKVDCIKNPCRYHRVESKEYNCGKLAPDNLCLDAFYVAYPYCLALLYGAKFSFSKNNVTEVRCPFPEHFIAMEIIGYKILPKFVIRLKEKLLKFLQKCNLPLEFPHQKIKIRVIRSVNCPRGYRVGDEFEFNIWKKDELCPAGFNALFPFLPTEDKIKIHCPDPRGVIYEKR